MASVRVSLRLSVARSTSSPFANCTQAWRRTYATESAVYSKRRGAGASAKSTHRTTNVSSAAPSKTSTKVDERAAGHASQNSAVADAKALASSSTQTSSATSSSSPASTSKAAAQSRHEAAQKDMTNEERQIQELEAVEYFKKVMKSADPFGQPIEASLDVVLPRPAGLTKISQLGGLGGWWKQFTENRTNGIKNWMSLLYLAGDDSLPGYKFGKIPWYKSIGWLIKANKTTSTKDGTWVSPLRKIALGAYRELNQQVARGDPKAVKTLTAASYQTELLRRIKRQPAHLTFRFNLEREVTPTKIVSLRAAQYYMGKEDPRLGSRYLVHALVRFDTEQSLEIYGHRGEPLHEVAEGAVKRADGTIAAKPRRVTEYLVLEKRMWYDTPWVFREQRWESV